MKTFIALIFFGCLTISSNAQSLDCDDGMTSFTEVNCTDDYLSFVVTSNNVRTLEFNMLPEGYQWSLEAGSLNFNATNPTSLVLFTTNFTVPLSVMVSNISNPGCGVFNLSPIYIETRNSTDCPDLSLLLNQGDVRPIPTLGQWGLIVLALILSISGITLIRRAKLAI